MHYILFYKNAADYSSGGARFAMNILPMRGRHMIAENS